MEYEVFLRYAFPILGITVIAIPLCIGLAYLIGYVTQKNNIKKGLDKDDIGRPISKASLAVMITLGSIVLISIAVVFILGTFLGWDSPI